MSRDPFDFSEMDVRPEVPADVRPDFLAGLNPPQREAVETLDGPLLVLAGAGTGKTRVLTARIANLIASGRAHPSGILAVTFTNRAAREMSERIEHLLGRPAAGLAIGTFHSISARWLRRHADLVGLRADFTILDADDQLRLMKQILKENDIDEKKWPARALSAIIERWKNRALSPDAVANSSEADFANGRAASLYRLYEERLRLLNACDFGNLLLNMITLFRTDAALLASYRRRFTHILVDEYQDSNVAQYLWLKLLAQEKGNICCVGDDDQSIYGWRGAEIGNILRFEKDFPGAKIIRLEQNYRSSGHILGAASSLIAANEGRLGKTLWTASDKGARLKLIGVWDAEEEARVIGERIEAAHAAGRPLREIAILVRAGYQTREFEDRMLALRLPYRVVGGPRFYERAEIRDALAYLRIVHQREDGLAFERIINVPKRGIGTTTLQALHSLSRIEGISLPRAAEHILESEDLPKRARTALGSLMADLAHWRELANSLAPHELAERVLEESGYLDLWRTAKTADAPGRLDNLEEFVRAIADFEKLGDFLEHVSLVMEMQGEAGSESLSIMTLHAAKGLEFDMVFLPGWEEGVFPNQRALEESGARALEEERRLAYVGITRARKEVVLSFAANRRIFGQWQSSLPSRFLDEIAPEHVEREVERGLYRGPDVGAGQVFQGYDIEPMRGPGWDRARSRGLGATSGESRAERIARARAAASPAGRRPRPLEAASETPRFSDGERVFHDKFGYGHVLESEGGKTRVAFEHGGEKMVLQSFLRSA